MRIILPVLAAAALFACAALPAHAQLGGLVGGLTNTVTNVVDNTVGAVGGTVNNTVNTVNNTVGDVLDLANNTVDGVLPGNPGGGGGGAGPGFLVPGGSGGELPDSLIAQLRQLIEIIRARDWERYGLANARIGAVDLRRWIPQDNWGDLNTVMVNYAGDIMDLQQSIVSGTVMPGWTGFRRLPVTRIVAFDYDESDGRIVLYFS